MLCYSMCRVQFSIMFLLFLLDRRSLNIGLLVEMAFLSDCYEGYSDMYNMKTVLCDKRGGVEIV